MKQIVCIGSKDAGTKNDVQVLVRSLQEQGLHAEARVCYWEDLVFSIGTQGVTIADAATGVDLAAADLVVALNWYKTGGLGYYRDLAFTLALYLQHAGTEFWNSEMLQQRSTTKLSALTQLALSGVAVPQTVFSLHRAALVEATADMGLPLVVKTIAGSRGADNHLVRTEAELRDLLDADGGRTPFMVEEFIPNDHDLRVVCYGGKPALVIKRSRTSNQTHLNNTSQGATAELLPLAEVDPGVIQMSETACRLLGREIAGVDILLANDGSKRMVCLEVNAIPQLTSGSYTSQKAAQLAEVISNYLKG